MSRPTSRPCCGRSRSSWRRTISAIRRARSVANIRTYLAEHGVVADRIELLTCPRTARPRVQSALGLVLLPRRLSRSPWSPRCTTPTADGTPICCDRTTPGGRRWTRTSMSRRSSRWADQYLMRTPPPGAGLSVSIALRQDGTTPFVATLTGTGRPSHHRSVLGALVRVPMVTLRTRRPDSLAGHPALAAGVPVQRRPADATGDERTPRGDVGDGRDDGDRAARGCPAA